MAARQSPLSSPPVSASLHLSFLCDEVERKNQQQQQQKKEAARSGKQGAHKRGEQMFPRCGLRLQEGTLKLAGLHTGCFVHLLLPNSPLPLPGHASVSPPLAFEVRTRLRKQGAAIDFLPVLEQECVDNPPPLLCLPIPSLSKSSMLLMSRVLVPLGPQGQGPYTLTEPTAFRQNHPRQQVFGY